MVGSRSSRFPSLRTWTALLSVAVNVVAALKLQGGKRGKQKNKGNNKRNIKNKTGLDLEADPEEGDGSTSDSSSTNATNVTTVSTFDEAPGAISASAAYSSPTGGGLKSALLKGPSKRKMEGMSVKLDPSTLYKGLPHSYEPKHETGEAGKVLCKALWQKKYALLLIKDETMWQTRDEREQHREALAKLFGKLKDTFEGMVKHGIPLVLMESDEVLDLENPDALGDQQAKAGVAEAGSVGVHTSVLEDQAQAGVRVHTSEDVLGDPAEKIAGSALADVEDHAQAGALGRTTIKVEDFHSSTPQNFYLLTFDALLDYMREVYAAIQWSLEYEEGVTSPDLARLYAIVDDIASCDNEDLIKKKDDILDENARPSLETLKKFFDKAEKDPSVKAAAGMRERAVKKRENFLKGACQSTREKWIFGPDFFSDNVDVVSGGRAEQPSGSAGGAFSSSSMQEQEDRSNPSDAEQEETVDIAMWELTASSGSPSSRAHHAQEDEEDNVEKRSLTSSRSALLRTKICCASKESPMPDEGTSSCTSLTQQRQTRSRNKDGEQHAEEAGERAQSTRPKSPEELLNDLKRKIMHSSVVQKGMEKLRGPLTVLLNMLSCQAHRRRSTPFLLSHAHEVTEAPLLNPIEDPEKRRLLRNKRFLALRFDSDFWASHLRGLAWGSLDFFLDVVENDDPSWHLEKKMLVEQWPTADLAAKEIVIIATRRELLDKESGVPVVPGVSFAPERLLARRCERRATKSSSTSEKRAAAVTLTSSSTASSAPSKSVDREVPSREDGEAASASGMDVGRPQSGSEGEATSSSSSGGQQVVASAPDELLASSPQDEQDHESDSSLRELEAGAESGVEGDVDGESADQSGNECTTPLFLDTTDYTTVTTDPAAERRLSKKVEEIHVSTPSSTHTTSKPFLPLTLSPVTGGGSSCPGAGGATAIEGEAEDLPTVPGHDPSDSECTRKVLRTAEQASTRCDVGAEETTKKKNNRTKRKTTALSLSATASSSKTGSTTAAPEPVLCSTTTPPPKQIQIPSSATVQQDERREAQTQSTEKQEDILLEPCVRVQRKPGGAIPGHDCFRDDEVDDPSRAGTAPAAVDPQVKSGKKSDTIKSPGSLSGSATPASTMAASTRAPSPVPYGEGPDATDGVETLSPSSSKAEIDTNADPDDAELRVRDYLNAAKKMEVAFARLTVSDDSKAMLTDDDDQHEEKVQSDEDDLDQHSVSEEPETKMLQSEERSEGEQDGLVLEEHKERRTVDLAVGSDEGEADLDLAWFGPTPAPSELDQEEFQERYREVLGISCESQEDDTHK
ncbi:unnamed protein product [Amoebophrya sp. A25]|nr:unnamed protein product [Amoebophrya sp. A25]|eukprot:GSA25T00010966001.1